jgi:hypothetical protein
MPLSVRAERKAWEKDDPGVRKPPLNPWQPLFGRKSGLVFYFSDHGLLFGSTVLR